ncbi:Sodium/solute symporter superfamily [Sesbania bispinosa]|nr:Sodium/solute symporter superfamily [Sesbania bispinosa]
MEAMDHFDPYQKREAVAGCYQTVVSNPNAIWQSESVLTYYLPAFATQVAFMLISTRCIYFILRPLHQPRIVIEILMGFMISPEVLGSTPLFEVLVPLKSVISTETISYMGLIYYVFLAGLDMNLDTILRARKKATTIAIAGIVIPMVMGAGIYALLQSMYEAPSEYLSHHSRAKAYLFWALVFSVTGFPVVTQILADLKLLYTGLGKVALTAAMITDFYNWVIFALLIPYALNEGSPMFSVLSTIAFVLFCFIVVRPYLVQLIVRKTNQNEWDNYQMFCVMMGAFACSTVTDLLGTHPVVGALMYGIMIPRGKFTEMLKDKTEDFGVVFLGTLFFGNCGIRLRIISVIQTQGFLLVLAIMLLTCIPKILSIVIATQFFGMPARDSVAIGLLMNTKGVLPFIVLNIAWDKQVISVESYSILTTSVLVMTIMVPLIINAIYKPRKLYKQNKLRTIQNLKAEADLRVLACVHNPRQATGMISILQACNAVKLSPLRVFALQLIELTGNNTSLLAAHLDQPNQQQNGEQVLTQTQHDMEIITNTFESLCAADNQNTRVETLAAASTYSTIHEDIYTLAQEKQATLILLPFHKQSSIEGILEITNSAFKHINQNVMKDAPCSVAIFVDRGLGSLFKVNLRVIMVFIGGPDDREALAVAWRMSKHQGIQLSVVRILLLGEAAEADTTPQLESRGLLSAVVDYERQKELDDEYLSLFRLHAVNKEDSITYSEKEVNSRDDIAEVLNQIDQIGCDLYILGQGTGRHSLVLSELMKWTDCPELGVIGDMMASNNFGSSSSILVVQQYGFGGMVFETTTRNPSEVPANNDGSDAHFVEIE